MVEVSHGAGPTKTCDMSLKHESRLMRLMGWRCPPNQLDMFSKHEFRLLRLTGWRCLRGEVGSTKTCDAPLWLRKPMGWIEVKKQV